MEKIVKWLLYFKFDGYYLTLVRESNSWLDKNCIWYSGLALEPQLKSKYELKNQNQTKTKEQNFNYILF